MWEWIWQNVEAPVGGFISLWSNFILLLICFRSFKCLCIRPSLIVHTNLRLSNCFPGILWDKTGPAPCVRHYFVSFSPSCLKSIDCLQLVAFLRLTKKPAGTSVQSTVHCSARGQQRLTGQSVFFIIKHWSVLFPTLLISQRGTAAIMAQSSAISSTDASVTVWTRGCGCGYHDPVTPLVWVR